MGFCGVFVCVCVCCEGFVWVLLLVCGFFCVFGGRLWVLFRGFGFLVVFFFNWRGCSGTVVQIKIKLVKKSENNWNLKIKYFKSSIFALAAFRNIINISLIYAIWKVYSPNQFLVLYIFICKKEKCDVWTLTLSHCKWKNPKTPNQTWI